MKNAIRPVAAALLAATLLPVFLLISPLALAAVAQTQQVIGAFTITVKNQSFPCQFCVGDTISYSLDFSQIATVNPQNFSDATYVRVLLVGPPQDESVDPTGISRTPLAVTILDPTPVSTFKNPVTYTIPDTFKGFVGLFLHAVASYESNLGQTDAPQNTANSRPSFSIPSICGSETLPPSRLAAAADRDSGTLSSTSSRTAKTSSTFSQTWPTTPGYNLVSDARRSATGSLALKLCLSFISILPLL
ncbi:hypothetical protein DFJ73DRAFT_864426, partial [Zopfochytrium polystomum]